MSILLWGGGAAAPSVPAAPAAGVETGAPRVPVSKLPRIVFTVDGSPVDLSDWSFSNTADLGYDQLRGRFAGTKGRRFISGVDQGARIRAFTESGTPVWDGRLSAPPKIAQDGVVSIAAQGHGYDAVKSANRVTPILGSPGAWVPASQPPLDYPTDATDVVVTSTLTSRQVSVTGLGTAGPNDNHAVAFWAPGSKLTRVKFEHGDAESVSAGDVQSLDILSADGPSIGRTARIEATFAPPWSIGDIRDVTIRNPGDTVIVRQFDNAFIAGSGDPTLRSPIVWGDYAYDLIYSGHGARMAARMMGWDAGGVVGTGTAPHSSLDYAGGPAGILSYLASIEDYCWGAWDDLGQGPQLTFGPYGRRTWEVSAQTGAVWDLDPLERIRAVAIQFLNIDNSLNTVVIEAPSATDLPNAVQTELIGTLQDQQENTLVAMNSAWRKLQRYVSQRYRGRISFARAFEAGTNREATYEVRAGDNIRILDAFMDGSITLPIHDVEMGPSGVVIGVNAPALPLGAMAPAGTSATSITGGTPLASSTGGTAVYAPPGATGIGGGNDIIIDPFPSGGGGKGGLNLGKYGK